MELIEQSCIANCSGDHRQALSKAKEASNKERNLIRLQEQAGLGDHHNIDLTYAVKNYDCCIMNGCLLNTFSGTFYSS